MVHITRLQLRNFRSYEDLILDDPGINHVILCGQNGAGKTNILESVSMLFPGKGLRGAKPLEMQTSTTPYPPWAVSVHLYGQYGPVQLGVGMNPEKGKKTFRINGTPSRTQTELAEWLSLLWLTPQMDRLFIESSGHRRQFFDRLIFTFDPGHAGRLTRYEKAMRQRLKLLKDGQDDDVWLSGLEVQMAETGIAIMMARNSFCQKLEQAYFEATREESDYFPKAKLTLYDPIINISHNNNSLHLEEAFQQLLSRNRHQDRDQGVTQNGPHRADFLVFFSNKDMPAAQCSTGEQKALLIGIILAHARLVTHERGEAPILLLDEIVAHLDDQRRAVLAEILFDYTSQTWMTGTDQGLFNAFSPQASFLNVCESLVTG